MKTLTKIKPYSDNSLTWNSETNQYELTIQYVKDNFEESYVDDGVLQKRIHKNSRKVYRAIKYRVYSRNRVLVEKLINGTEQGREFIKEMLSAQMEADVGTGYNDLSETPAINLANGQIIDRNELYRNQLCVDAEQVFDSSDDYFGFRIGYQAAFPPYFFVFFRGL